MLHIFHEDPPDKFSVIDKYDTKTLGRDTKTHRVFLDTEDSALLAAPTDAQPRPRRSAVLGTFRVLVYGM